MNKNLVKVITTVLALGLVTGVNGEQITNKTNCSTIATSMANQDQHANESYNQAFIGQWVGTLKVSDAQTLEMQLNLNTENNCLVATMDVPAQGQMGIAFDSVSLVGNELSIKLSAASIAIKGTLKNGTIVAEYEQGRFKAPIVFSTNAPLAERQMKAQELTGAANYQVNDVSFYNEQSGVTLAGSLSVPNTEVKYAAIILSGSGATTRDGDAYGHKLYKVLADLLTKQGIAVLRFDDRGVGQSTGDFASATSADFATDANAALTFLRSRSEFSGAQVGFIGHSEGGLIAAIALADQKMAPADFFVSLAGPGTTGEQLLVDQTNMILKQQNVPNELFEQASRQQAQIMAAIANDSSNETLLQLLRAAGQSEQQAQAELTQLTSNWMKYFVKSDVTKYLKQVKVPVLALNGAKDVQVPAQQNIDGFIASVEKQWLTYKVYPELNHLFQPATTGLPNEYSQIETTISPIVAEDIHHWLNTL